MGLRRIFMAYHTPRSMEVDAWFHETFGEPQPWDGVMVEPVGLKKNFQWALGMHRPVGLDRPSPCIWCTEKAYMTYALRWL